MARVALVVANQGRTEFFSLTTLHENKIIADIYRYTVPGSHPIACTDQLDTELLGSTSLGMNGQTDRVRKFFGDELSPSIASPQNFISLCPGLFLQGILALGLTRNRRVFKQESRGAAIVAMGIALLTAGRLFATSPYRFA